ncbi:elastase-1-like [Anguilla rostrata]|uniref:elastase-1-like n=1 Tax=Anguilla anguilla TaxID=7936 RepID=UPI0015B24126|nr:elastase-1-like [Anguilla anguilla]
MMWFVVLLSCFGVSNGRTPLNHAVYNEKLNERVVGGSDAQPNSWKWQVSLQFDSSSQQEYYHICGGTIIGSSHVLTAAHCILSYDARHYRVVTGEHNLYKYDGSEQFSFVDNILIHPGWTGDLGNGNDIALLKLVAPIYDNGFVRLADLPYAGEVLPNDFTCYITGWGLLATGGSVPDILQEAPIHVVEHKVCSTHDWWGSLAKKTMICAGGDGKTAGCQGDSGGPLNCFTDGAWRVHGVVSYGPGGNCNTIRKPTVFTRVSSFTDWIYSVILS